MLPLYGLCSAVARADAKGQPQLDAFNIMVGRCRGAAVSETKEAAAAEHATELLRHDQVCFVIGMDLCVLWREGKEGGASASVVILIFLDPFSGHTLGVGHKRKELESSLSREQVARAELQKWLKYQR
jgi:hypothetical protein